MDSQEGKDTCTHPTRHHPHVPHIPHQRDGEKHHKKRLCQQWDWDRGPKQGSCRGRLYLEELKSILPLEYKRIPWGNISLSCRAEAASRELSQKGCAATAVTLCAKLARPCAAAEYSLTARPCAAHQSREVRNC